MATTDTSEIAKAVADEIERREAEKNMENIRKLYEMVGKGEFDPKHEQDLLRQMSALLQQSITAQANQIQAHNELSNSVVQLAQQTAQLAKEMNLHAPYLNAWKVVADAITNPEKRARAKKAIEALSQRKLNEYES